MASATAPAKDGFREPPSRRAMGAVERSMPAKGGQTAARARGKLFFSTLRARLWEAAISYRRTHQVGPYY